MMEKISDPFAALSSRRKRRTKKSGKGLQQNALCENDLNRLFQWNSVIQPTAWESSLGHVHVLMRSTP
ncbi:MAG: hypothetical protein ACSLEN_02405 [Candidatus Malihini olakiniferum]